MYLFCGWSLIYIYLFKCINMTPKFMSHMLFICSSFNEIHMSVTLLSPAVFLNLWKSSYLLSKLPI